MNIFTSTTTETTVYEDSSTRVIDAYKEFVSDVVLWNNIGREETPQDQIEMQVMVTVEEIEETVEAIHQMDHVEVLDGVSDVLVTAGYLAYLNNVIIGSPDPYHIDTSYRNSLSALDILGKMKYDVEKKNTAYHADIVSLIIWAIYYYGEDKVFNYIKAVLKSNHSKFIKIDSADKLSVDLVSREVEIANRVYGDRYSDITMVKRVINGDTYLLLRADGGVGKIVKPTTYMEPTDILESMGVGSNNICGE